MYTIKVKIDKEKVKELAFNWLVMDDMIGEKERGLIDSVEVNKSGDMLVVFNIGE
jgi:hypothetical protein